MPRSYYLDDMEGFVREGDKVICKANLESPNLTVGKLYKVMQGMMIKDDNNLLTFPSARFMKG